MDGTAGAYVAHLFNGDHPYDLFGTKPGLLNYDFPNVEGKTVVIIDISFQREIMISLHEKAKWLICLDHHKTAEEQLSGLDFCYFDMSRSGVQMAWDFFFENVKRPKFIDYIGWRDLWKFDTPNTEEFSSGLFNKTSNYTTTQKFDLFDSLLSAEMYWDRGWVNTCNSNIDDTREYQNITNIGKLNIEINNKQVANACNYATLCRMPAINNCPEYTVWATDSRIAQDRSKVGNILSLREDCDFAATYSYSLKDDVWWISLRSNKSKTDVSVVASQYELGGGHACASGFTWRGNIRDLFIPIDDP